MKNPSISVDREKKKIAIFDGDERKTPLVSFENEAKALEEARVIIARHTQKAPEVVYLGQTNQVSQAPKKKGRHK